MARYVYKGAKLNCSLGTSPAFLDIEDRGMDGVGDGRFPAFKQDREPIKNIPSFGKCKVNAPFYPPCVPAPVPVWDVVVNSTSYHLLGEEYQNAYKEFVQTLGDCVQKTFAYYRDLHNCAYLAKTDNQYTVYKSGRKNAAIEKAFNMLGSIEEDYLTNETSIRALSEGHRDTNEQKLLGYYEVFLKLTACYDKMKASFKGKKNIYGQEFAELPYEKNILETKEYLEGQYNTTKELYEKLKAIEEANRVKKLASERLTMDSVLYCTNQGDGVITIETPTRPLNDYHHLKDRGIGIYRTKFGSPLLGMTLCIPQANIEMLTQYDTETKQHFLLNEYDFVYLLPLLGICEPDEYDDVKDKYVHMSVQELLELVNIEIPDTRKEGGKWYLILDETAKSTEERYHNVLGTLGLANVLQANMLRGEYNARSPIPIPFSTVNTYGLIHYGVKFRMQANFDTEPFLEMMEPSYKEFMQHISDFLSGITADIKFQSADDGGTEFNEARITLENKKIPLKVQIGTKESGLFSNTQFPVDAGLMLYGKQVWEKDIEKLLSGKGIYISTKNYTWKIFYLKNYIRVVVECKHFLNLSKELKDDESSYFIPYIDVHILVKQDTKDQLSLLLPEKHRIWIRLLPNEMYQYVYDIESLEQQLGHVLRTVLLTTEEKIVLVIIGAVVLVVLIVVAVIYVGPVVAASASALAGLATQPGVMEGVRKGIDFIFEFFQVTVKA